MCLSFLPAFACTVVRVLLLEGKCMASLQEDPAEDSLCLACFCCATTVQGLNLTSASVMGNWTASFAERLLLIYRWTPFPAMSGRDPPKRGPPPHQFRPLPFSRRWTPFPAVSGRDPPKRGAATWHQMCCHLVLLSAFATHRGCTTVSSLGSCPLCLSACQGCFLLADPFPETLFGMSFAEHFIPGWPSLVGGADSPSPKSQRFNPAPGHVPFFPAGLCLHGSSCSSSWGKVHGFFARGSRWR